LDPLANCTKLTILYLTYCEALTGTSSVVGPENDCSCTWPPRPSLTWTPWHLCRSFAFSNPQVRWMPSRTARISRSSTATSAVPSQVRARAPRPRNHQLEALPAEASRSAVAVL